MKQTNLFWFLLFSICLVVLDWFGFLSPLKQSVEKAVLPIKQTVYGVNVEVKNAGILIFRYPEFQRKFEELEKLQKKEEELVLQVKFLTEENKLLRDQLQAPLPPSFEFIPAPVLSVSRFMELGVGKKSGVKEGMAVVDGTIFIGKVTKVSPLRSNVMLVSDSEMRIPAETSREAKGTVLGQSGQSVILDEVLQKDPLFLEDQVLTSGQEGFPANLIIGKISYINTDDTSVYKQAKIDVPLDYKREKIVFVISSL